MGGASTTPAEWGNREIELSAESSSSSVQRNGVCPGCGSVQGASAGTVQRSGGGQSTEEELVKSHEAEVEVVVAHEDEQG